MILPNRQVEGNVGRQEGFGCRDNRRPRHGGRSVSGMEAPRRARAAQKRKRECSGLGTLSLPQLSPSSTPTPYNVSARRHGVKPFFETPAGVLAAPPADTCRQARDTAQTRWPARGSGMRLVAPICMVIRELARGWTCIVSSPALLGHTATACTTPPRNPVSDAPASTGCRVNGNGHIVDPHRYRCMRQRWGIMPKRYQRPEQR